LLSNHSAVVLLCKITAGLLGKIGMRRKHKVKREIHPDPKYNNVLVSKFINYVMRKGKKSLAQRIVYDAFFEVEKKLNKPALEIFDTAVKNASPLMEVRPRRIGGATYQVPKEVKGERRTALAMKWIIDAAKQRKGQPMSKKLAQEIIDAFNNEGAAVKKKNDTHRMAEANKAFAHFG